MIAGDADPAPQEDESVPHEDPRDKDVGDQLPEEQEESVVEEADPGAEPEMGGTPPP